MTKALRIYLLLFFLLFGTAAPGLAQDYIVGEGDVLKIDVYDHQDLTTTVRVGGDGSIVMPLLGEIVVLGLSVSRAAEKISGLLADGYIVNPQVRVFIEEFRSKKVIILGQVSKPGLYELRGQTTLLELVSKAGGLKDDAGEKAIIKRKPKSGAQKDKDVIMVNLKSLVEQGDTELNIQIVDGDSIYITKAGVFYVTGEVKKPDAYKYEETTVIKAITMAGGFSDKAAPNHVRIIRKINGEETVIQGVKMDDRIQPDDVVVVPESFF